MLGSDCSGLRALYSTGDTESLRVFKEGGCGGLECCLAEIFLASVSRDGQSCGDSRQEVSVTAQTGGDHGPSDRGSCGMSRKCSARDSVQQNVLGHENRLDMGW